MHPPKCNVYIHIVVVIREDVKGPEPPGGHKDVDTAAARLVNVKDMMLSRFHGGLPDKEQCKQQ